MKLSDLATVLRRGGIKVVETAGWSTRGYNGQDLARVDGVLWHHTATNRNAFIGNPAPTLNLCIAGRSDLPGPLCHIVLGRDGTCYLIAAGLANHAGRGTGAGIPTDSGNYYLIGIEMESSGVAPWDWTPEQLYWAPKVGAVLERAYLEDQPAELRLQIGHMEYSYEGKIDPAGWPGGMDGLRASITAELNGGTVTAQSTTTQEEDDNMLFIVKQDKQDAIWIGDMVTRRHIKSGKVLQSIQHVASLLPGKFFDGGKVQTWEDIEILGQDVTAATAGAILDANIGWYGFDGKVQPADKRNTTTLRTDLAWADARAQGTNGLIAGLTAKVDALAGLLTDTSTVELSKEELLARVDEKIDAALKPLSEYKPVLVPKEG